LFPDASIARMDADTTIRKAAFEEILGGLRSKKTDILIGTQMVTKGLDFPDVTLVGVIFADQMLRSDAFNAHEQAFAMLTQVIGRAGRAGKSGVAVIQTTDVRNDVLRLAATQDYAAFYRGEIESRKERAYPPFADLCIVMFSSANDGEAEMAANEFYGNFTGLVKSGGDMRVNIYPPARAGLYKVNNKYRYKVFMKCRNDRKFRDAVRGCMGAFYGDRRFRGVGMSVDLNPINS